MKGLIFVLKFSIRILKLYTVYFLKHYINLCGLAWLVPFIA